MHREVWKWRHVQESTSTEKSADGGNSTGTVHAPRSLQMAVCPGQCMHQEVCRWRHVQDSTCTEKSADGGMARTVHALRSLQMAAGGTLSQAG